MLRDFHQNIPISRGMYVKISTCVECCTAEAFDCGHVGVFLLNQKPMLDDESASKKRKRTLLEQVSAEEVDASIKKRLY